ncbi:hypothetical protein JTE90_026691 [Oedothorax gibbosus]|uniref:Dynein attachment factor N-terminal domain-containing protein n=1 Tax=Oedothorax gibbosus TaxID=931172 RepID=A0AAV6V2A3_9ARAC|nr:hypothetical protein JTE90_026691 [Oedothorax gibbosus]
MISAEDSNVDFDALGNNLEEAIEADRVYSLQNAAKIRAINQRGTTYEDFENSVKGATLKPVEKGDKLSSNPRQTWNPFAKNIVNDSVADVLKWGKNKK